MKRINLLLISIFILCGNVFAQSSRHEELAWYVEKQNSVLPIAYSIGPYKAAITKAYVDGNYFRLDAEVYDKALYKALSATDKKLLKTTSLIV